MSVRPVFAVLIALAMLLAPFAMQSGSAHAAMPSDHQARSSQVTHCPGADSKADSSVDHSCASMCAATAIGPALADLPMLGRGDNQPSIEQFGRSHVAKLPTPPPRAV